MPNIDLIPVPLFDPNSPYHYHYDNLPLQSLMKQMGLINSSVDNVAQILRESQGTQGTLSNRLNQSTDGDGNLRSDAVDESLHNIGSHSDGSYLGIDYVRMTLDERNKLDLIADDATSLYLTVNDVDFSIGQLILDDSSTITWELISPNILKAHMAFSSSAAHRHYYDIEPSTSDYLNFTTPYPFIDGSLRVYVNGIRLSESEVYVPSYLISNPWSLVSVIVDDYATGTFHLSSTIDENDVIKVDFDISLA